MKDFIRGMAEWFKAPVSKTDEVKTSVGSNPTSSAIFSGAWFRSSSLFSG